ncbi:MAG: PQQ-dependent sugar dehydrogenase [Chloroflexi bacterium]|nr:PQQ-dependent sugar dehydrogenase [Chloroflexota bacterium]
MTACGGGTPAEEAIDTPAGESITVDVETIAEGLTAPTAFAAPDDGTGRLFIGEQTGAVKVIEDGVVRADPLLDVSSELVELAAQYDERGLLGLALHPDFAENGRFYIYYSAPLAAGAPADFDHTTVLAEYSAPDGQTADPGSANVLMTFDQPYANHNGGQLAFGPDGMLYLGLGDGGSAGDPLNNGQNAKTPLGTILRLDVDGDSLIPADNPFGTEVYAYGLRNPYRFSFDEELGLLAGDVGQNEYEEVNIIEAGGNYGWAIREATHCYSPEEDCPATAESGDPLLPPVIEYDHDLGLSVIGGYVYRGEAIPALQGRYVFGDWSRSFLPPQGHVFAAVPGGEDGLWGFDPLIFTGTGSGQPGRYYVTGFGMDTAGELYILADSNVGPTGTGGAVLKIVPAG